MTTQTTPQPASSLYRIDRFIVPATAVAAFGERLHYIQQLLAQQPGVRQNLVLTQETGSAETHMLTVVEWESAEAMTAAKAVAQRHYAEQGFDPKAFMQQHGVRPDFGVYRLI